MSNKNIIGIILAAGEGTRMKSSIPKVLHTICGKPMLSFVVNSLEKLRCKDIVVVVGHKADEIKNFFDNKNIKFANQEKQLGSGDAVKAALSAIPRNYDGKIIITCGDTPFLTTKTLSNLVKYHEKFKNLVTILTAEFNDPFGYGRIIRDENGFVTAIVEEKDANFEQKKVREINSGVYCFNAKELRENILKIKPNNKKKEYYLTDVIEIIKNKSGKVGAFVVDDNDEILGINTKKDLVNAGMILNGRILDEHMLNGVRIVNPNNTFIDEEVIIGKDTVVLTGSIITGKTKIAESCVVGPNSVINNSYIDEKTTVASSYVLESKIGKGVKIGPFTHIRPNTVIKDHARVGNFTETKKTIIGKNSKASHLTYLGDTVIGDNVNIGAGTITCNYDGTNKHKTIIGDGAFIGSNSNLVAPVKIGKKVLVAAGSTIYENVKDGELAIARSRQVNKARKKK